MFKVVFLILVECHRLSQADLILVFLTRTLPYARVFDLKVNPLPKLANLFTPVSRMNNVNSFTSNIEVSMSMLKKILILFFPALESLSCSKRRT